MGAVVVESAVCVDVGGWLVVDASVEAWFEAESNVAVGKSVSDVDARGVLEDDFSKSVACVENVIGGW